MSPPSRIFLISMSPDRERALAELRSHDPLARIDLIANRDEYEAIKPSIEGDTLLLSYDSGILIAGEVLDRLSRPAYNFHPAPPEYPGRDCYHFAVYEGAARYGATVHEMIAAIDAGPIVAYRRFDVSATNSPADLLASSRALLRQMFDDLAPAFMSGAPIPRLDVAWGSRKTTRAMFHRMCELPPDIDEQEFERRYRAFDGGEWDNLTLTLHGRRFRIDKGAR